MDTSTHKLILASDECSSCWEDQFKSQKYDIDPREQSGEAYVLTREIESRYGTLALKGKNVQDRICLEEQQINCFDD